MGILRRGLIVMLAAGAVALLSGVAPAGAADTITANKDCCAFDAGPYSQDLGEIPTFSNPEVADAPHNVTATAKGPDRGPLFRSTTIGAGNSTPVAGAQYLGAGTYPFFCTLHGPSMSGELTVQGDKGTVAARPSIRVSVLAQRLKKVRKSGRLKVRVKANTKSPGIRISARRGKKALTSASKLSLVAGVSRTVKLKLSRAGRKALAKGRKVGISANGTVAFGKPSSSKRTLR
jgi:plastocyanin